VEILIGQNQAEVHRGQENSRKPDDIDINGQVDKIWQTLDQWEQQRVGNGDICSVYPGEESDREGNQETQKYKKGK